MNDNTQAILDKIINCDTHFEDGQIKALEQILTVQESDSVITKRMIWKAVKDIYPNEDLPEDKFERIKLVDILDWLDKEGE